MICGLLCGRMLALSSLRGTYHTDDIGLAGSTAGTTQEHNTDHSCHPKKKKSEAL